MKKNYLSIFIMGAVASLIIISIFAFEEKDNPGKNNETLNQWKIPKLPAEISFAGEKVPLEKWEIKEQFDRQFTMIYYQTGTQLTVMKYANRWLPYIAETLKKNGIPEDFKYLCIAESNLQNLTSRVGAVGFWQFMDYTAPGFGIEINKNVDERYNVYKSTEAACKYLKQAYAKFGNWTAAAASYNCGQGRYNEQATFQQTRYYYDLHLPEETNQYMFRILSFKHLLENAEALGYITDSEELYKPYNTRQVSVSQTIPNLATYALQNGTTYKMLRILNPWLRSRTLPVKAGKTYSLLLPAA